MESALELEHLVGGVVSAAYGQNATRASELQYEMLSRISIEQRISLLKRLLDERELAGEFAFVVPVLSRLFELRNTLAHGISHGHTEASNSIRVVTYQKGVEKEHYYSPLYLHWLLYEQLPVVMKELDSLYYLIAPSSQVWHDS